MTHLETVSGEQIGRDPRQMTQEELRQLGHEPMSAQEALRLRCLDCCAEQIAEVRKCVSIRCPAWPFRMGKSPWKEKRVMSEEQRLAAAERLKRARLDRAA
jgi:hypothetical protein